VSSSSRVPVALGRVDASEPRADLRESQRTDGDVMGEAECARGNYAMIDIKPLTCWISMCPVAV
jgi:hypothetical protein